jgi:hypothetical protein
MYENNHLDDIIMVLYDALFTKTYIEDDIIKNYKKETDILIRLKNKFDIFLIIHKRARKFIGFNKSKCVLKGFTKTKGIEEFLYNNLYLEIINDKPLGLIMEKLQEKFMNSNNIDLFKLQKHNTEYIIIDNKEIEYNNQQIEELDKIYYLNHIIKPIMDNMIIDLFQKEQYEKFKNIYKK